ncbi:MAG TPA: pilus assembly protein N-terminal domain-containing protein [Vicinamibacterales bacterium]
MNAQLASGAPRLLSPARATAMCLALLLSAGTALAQSLTVPNLPHAMAGAAPASASAEANASEIALLVGRSTLINVGTHITRVSLTSPDVADALVTSPNQLLVHGKTPGTISLFVWDRAGGIRRYEVVVRRDLSELVDQMKTLFPGEEIQVHSNGKDLVISGTVKSKYVVDKAAEVAAGYVEKKEDVVNLLRVQEGIASNQVLLRVRFAEVSRSALTELGASLFVDGYENQYGRVTTQQFAAPFFDQSDPILNESLVFSDYLNLFLFDSKNNIGGVVRALQSKGLFQSLAEPNLIAENGKEASFLAGGEYPYPVIQGTSGGQTVTIQFKEFGVKLNFTPTIVGENLVKLKVRPEVSSLDFSNAIVLEGFRIPAISTRRTETEVELSDGQTFAIAGLLNNTVQSQLSKVPGIGDIPILGLLFRSKAAQKNQTELVVMITPTILRRNSTGVSPKLPDQVEPYLGPIRKPVPAPAPWNPGGPSAAVQPQAQPAGPGQPVPATAYQPPALAAAEPAPALPAVDEKALERARKEAEERRKLEARRAEEARKQTEKERKLAAKRAKEEAKRAAEERRRAEKAAREQAKLQAEIDRRAAEAAKRQAELERKRAKEEAEARARLDAARKAYEEELARINAQHQPR